MQLSLKFKQLTREMGTTDALFYIAKRIITLLSFSRCRLIRYLIVAQPVPDKPILPSRRGAKIKVKEVRLGDPLIEAFPVPLSVTEERYSQGARCLVALENECFVGYLWFIADKYVEDEVRLHYILPESPLSVWDFDVYVCPKFRMSFVFLRLWDEAFSIFRTENIKYSYSRISAFNPASRASHKRLGAHPLFYINCFTVGSLQLTFSRRTPLLDISLSNKYSKYRLPLL